MKITRRKLLTTAALPVLGGVGVLGYGFLWESGWLRVREFELPLKGLAKPISLLHLADLHAGRDVPWSLIERGIDLGISLKPDLICLTGDFVTRKISKESHYADLLTRLSEHAPTFAVLGNHDGGRWAQKHRGYKNTTVMHDILATAGIPHMLNTSVRRFGINLVGLGDLWAKECKPVEVWSKPLPAGPTIVLSHNPDSKDEIPYDYDLMLCGHTHGGQLRIPFTGATPMTPVRDRRFVDGLYEWNGRHLHITRGVGNLMHARMNCRPEVSLLKLKPMA